ncbi:MAG: HAMP domain-containing histidine kinase [Lachnospiraceae bacterium]|nr:HAMP domain-containing histidine kinase [Lachnospiraceae bacterium]
MDKMEKEIKTDIDNDSKNDVGKENKVRKKHGAFFWFVLTFIFSCIAGVSILITALFWDHRMYDSTKLFRKNCNERLMTGYSVYALSDFSDDFNMGELKDTNFQYAVYKTDDPSSVDITDPESFLVCTIPEDVLKRESDRLFRYSATLGPNSYFNWNIDNIWNCYGYIISNHLYSNENTYEKHTISEIIYIWNTDRAYVISDGYYFPVNIFFEDKEGNRSYDVRGMVNSARDGWLENYRDYYALIDTESTETDTYVDIREIRVSGSGALAGYISSDELSEWYMDFTTWTVDIYRDGSEDNAPVSGEDYYLLARAADPLNTASDDLFAKSAPVIDLAISFRYLPIVVAGIFSLLAVMTFICFIIRFFAWTGKVWKKIRYQWRGNVNLLLRLIAVCTVFGIVELIFAGISIAGYSLEAALFFWCTTVLLAMAVFLIFALQLNRIAKGAERMASGEIGTPVDTRHMLFDFKKIGENINSAGIGMERAVQDRMKSERFKTELISNVSHDIKTPLTSIISYVELLKKQPEGSAPDPEYLDALERQSVKLKKLLEDLIEASKAQTGNLKADLVPCNVNMILHQVIGEYEEKLAANNIELKIRMPEEDVNIMADNQHLQRVLDNLFTNISKYSQPGTRAYLNLSGGSDEAVIELKNTSREPLNMTSDELLERFARGDSSRGSEGNGLGLSIAQSLTELMNGKLRLVVDGDLFKIILLFPRIGDQEL